MNPSSSTPKIFLSVLLASTAAAVYLKRRNITEKSIDGSNATTASIKELEGPSSPSWLAGNVLPLVNPQNNAGEEDERLTQKFGLAFRIKLGFSVDSLYIADPKALQYVLNTSGYKFHKRGAAKLSRMVLGKNIIGVDGEEHARQRRVLLPSFSQPNIRELVPAFTQTTAKVVEQWKDLIAAKQGEGVDIDLSMWLSRLTIDAFGQGILSYDFGALSNEPSKYAEAFRGLFVNVDSGLTGFQLAMATLLAKAPEFVGDLLVGAAARGTNVFGKFMSISNEIAMSVITREKEAARLGKTQSRDLLSILVRANMSEDSRTSLSDGEILSQLHAFTIAGHDTTSSMLQWIFYELALHPEAQDKIREEIRAIKEAKGVQELGASELDSLNYTNAVLKETLRYHPIALYNSRTADRDDIIPLAYPAKSTSGKEIHAIHIKKGQSVFISHYAYNRIEDLWGADPDKWIPERFLNEGESERAKRTIGVFAHLATFSSGVHGCIGWRFAVLEMQVVLTGLIEHFEFSLGTSNPTILKKLASTMYPTVKGEEDRGAQLPLFIRSIS